MANIKLTVGNTDITQYVSSIKWSGANTQVSRDLNFSIANNPYDKNFAPVNIKTGDVVKFYYDDKLKFVGRVYNRERKGDIGTVEITAKDYMFNLVQSTATYKFKKKTPEYIAKAVCKDFKVSVGKLPKTKHKIKTYIPSEMSPYNIILKAFQMAEKYTKKKYMLAMDGTKLTVMSRGTVVESVKLDSYSNIIGSTYSEDATEVINKVVVYNGKGQAIGSYQRKAEIDKYGVLQGAISVDKGKGNKEAKASYVSMSKEASIEAIGDIKCISGYALNIEDEATGLRGKYWIKSDSHSFENGIHTMTLDLAFTNENESVDYSKADSSGKVTNADGSVTKTTKKKYKAIFTAYSEKTGTGKDCKGHKLNAAKKTCAMGKSIAPYGAKVKISCKGQSINGKTYKVNDVPKHARLKGKVHVDILFKTNAQAKKFGTRYGEITVTKTIKVKTTAEASTTSLSGSSKGVNIANKALSKKGCKYVWGATGPNTFDCSGLVWWAHKKCGINFGRTNTKGLSKLGKNVSYSKMKIGDTIIFSSNGSYSGIHHTGIYIGNGKMVHAPHTGSTVRVQSITSGYYRRQFYCARRLY
jgi:cell wall-associated NlpC family hydrolase